MESLKHILPELELNQTKIIKKLKGPKRLILKRLKICQEKRRFHTSLFGIGTHQLYTMSSIRKSRKYLTLKKYKANLRGFIICEP